MRIFIYGDGLPMFHVARLAHPKRRKQLIIGTIPQRARPRKGSMLRKTLSWPPMANTQSRLFRKKAKFTAAKKCLFWSEGAGRHTDDVLAQIEAQVLQKFEAQRALGCVVHRRHLVNFFCSSCAELGINLIAEAEKRKWKNPERNIFLRIDRLCARKKIKSKPASRQLHKQPGVGTGNFRMHCIKRKYININAIQ